MFIQHYRNDYYINLTFNFSKYQLRENETMALIRYLLNLFSWGLGAYHRCYDNYVNQNN